MKAFLLLLTYAVAIAASEYSRVCNNAFCRVIEKSFQEIAALKSSVDEEFLVPSFGTKADEICNSALELFTSEAPLPDDSKENELLYDRKVEELEKLLDAPLHVLYLKQLSLLREKAMKAFKAALTTEGTEFEAMMRADELFRKEAQEFTRQNPEWSFAKEANALKSALLEVAQRSRKIQEVKAQATKQNNQAMQYLQQQQQQLQAMQQQIMGQGSPWNVGCAYRIPDTNINLSLGYQQGKGNIQISCVPDESVPLLGPNGFVHGVTPGNVGISFNINI